VAVVNQAFVKKFFPGEEPIGHHFGTDGQEHASAYEIVGMVADAKYNDPRGEFRAMYFRPVTQWNKNLKEPGSATGENRSLYINSITIHFESPPQNLDALIRRTFKSIDPHLTLVDLRSLDYQVAGNFNQERLISRLTVLFGALALILASVGLYGITAYSVARRTSEIGVRMALGANRGDVVKLVLQGAFTQVGIGLAIGIPIALLGGRVMASQLYGVRGHDPLALGGASVALCLSAAVAALVPARRAATIEPMAALRTE
jgi:ABC-type antimicrobial peptide transport system permease subunit